MKILESIHTAIWAIDPRIAQAYRPLVHQFEKGDYSVFANQKATERPPFALHARTGTGGTANTSSANQVASYTIEGVITKADQWCGGDGTLSLVRRMRQNDRDPSVAGHILAFDSGGGEAAYIQEAARIIRSEITKPVVAHFSGLMCSAAYGIGVAADEIYATEMTDVCGSIGVMMSFVDWQAALEKEGVVFHEIYADASSEKNADWQAAKAGDYTGIKEFWLNPFAESFINSVKSMRPSTAAHEDIFKGKTYMSAAAIERGLIDGTMTFENAVNRVFELADAAHQPISSSKKTTKMSIKLFGKVFGKVAEAENGDVTISAAQWQLFQDASTQFDVNAAEILNLKASASDSETKIAAMESDFEARIAALEEKPAVKPAAAVNPTSPVKVSAKDELNAKFAAKFLK